MNVSNPLRTLYWSASSLEVEAYDLAAINGQNTDLPREKHGEQLRTLRRHFVPVHRKRVSEKTVEVVTDENGEDIWIVGDAGEMPTSEMLDLAREYDRLPPRFSK